MVDRGRTSEPAREALEKPAFEFKASKPPALGPQVPPCTSPGGQRPAVEIPPSRPNTCSPGACNSSQAAGKRAPSPGRYREEDREETLESLSTSACLCLG